MASTAISAAISTHPGQPNSPTWVLSTWTPARPTIITSPLASPLMIPCEITAGQMLPVARRVHPSNTPSSVQNTVISNTPSTGWSG